MKVSYPLSFSVKLEIVFNFNSIGEGSNIFKLNDSGKFKNLAVIGAGLLFLHTFLLDFLDWNYNFFYE